MSQYHPDTSAFLDQQGRFAQQRGDTVTAQAFVNARLEYDRLNAQALELCAELSGLRRENERLRGLLGEAADDIEHWGGYASEYFKDKWHLEDDIKKYRDAALAGAAVQPSVGPWANIGPGLQECAFCHTTRHVQDQWERATSPAPAAKCACAEYYPELPHHPDCPTRATNPTSEILSTTAKGG